jgi:hypothetical protein
MAKKPDRFSTQFSIRDNQLMNKNLIEWDVACVLIGYGLDRQEARRIGKMCAEEAAKATLHIQYQR